MVWGALAQLGVGGLSGAASAVQTHHQTRKAEKFYRRRYRWTMEDMRKAGLNPILAAQPGAVGSGATVPATPSIGGAIASGASGIGSSVLRGREQRALLGSRVDEQVAKAQTARALAGREGAEEAGHADAVRGASEEEAPDLD